MRCVMCGGSRWDPKGYKCARCGGSPGFRHEQCYVTRETQIKCLAHARGLKKFGIVVEQPEVLQKVAVTTSEIAFALACAESFSPGVLRGLVIFLRDKVLLPESEILRLRLDEPEEILTYYRMDKRQAEVPAKRRRGQSNRTRKVRKRKTKRKGRQKKRIRRHSANSSTV
jgi:hypothetical protein